MQRYDEMWSGVFGQMRRGSQGLEWLGTFGREVEWFGDAVKVAMGKAWRGPRLVRQLKRGWVVAGIASARWGSVWQVRNGKQT